MAKNETSEERESRRVRRILEKCSFNPEFMKEQEKNFNDHKSQAAQRTAEAKRKCAERRERRELRNRMEPNSVINKPNSD